MGKGGIGGTNHKEAMKEASKEGGEIHDRIWENACRSTKVVREDLGGGDSIRLRLGSKKKKN